MASEWVNEGILPQKLSASNLSRVSFLLTGDGNTVRPRRESQTALSEKLLIPTLAKCLQLGPAVCNYVRVDVSLLASVCPASADSASSGEERRPALSR
jgi:hypothetical protein